MYGHFIFGMIVDIAPKFYLALSPIFGMIIDIAPKFYLALSLPFAYDLEVKVIDLEIYVKVLRQSF